MQFHSDQSKKKEHPPELIDAGRELLSFPDFSVSDSTYDYDLHSVANVCLRAESGMAAAKALCEQIKEGLSNYTFRAYNHEELLQSIFELQPRIALDVFFGSVPTTDSSDLASVEFDRFLRHRNNPLDKVPIEEVLRWCEEKPAERYPTISRSVSFGTGSDGGVRWTPLAMEMLKRAPDALIVLKLFVGNFRPRSWSGSLATIIESRLGLLDHLGELNNPSLEEYAKEIRPKLEFEIAETRRLEDERDSARDERFE